jgi:uncharacterized membrane protein
MGGDILVRIEKSIEIKARPEKVWEMLAFDKAVEWMEGWKSVKYTSEVRTPEDKYKVGASAHITEHVKYDFEITESLKTEKIVWRSKRERAKPDMIKSYVLKPTETGTLVTTVFDYTSPFSVSLNLLLYMQNQTLSKPNDDLVLFDKEFGGVLVLSRSCDFSPPVTMYKALKIGLESDDWNVTSLENMTARVSLDYCEFQNNPSNSSGYGFQLSHEVTQPVEDYSPVQVNGTTYRYAWVITVDKTQNLGLVHTPPYALYYVDAQTAELIPHGPLY